MKPTLISAVIVCAFSGCATALLEERVITDFVAALDEENVPAMRRVVSTEFERKAMRSDDVLRDLEIVKLPKGEMKIVEISEPSEDSRSVIVTDDSGDKFKFELVRDDQKQCWAVNDVLVRQQKKWKKVRSNVTWPTTQVLDLVFSVREYLDVWSGAERNLILARSTPALAASLESLPESWLPVITNGIAANYDPALARKPEAQLNNDSAVIRMPVRGGYRLVSAQQIDDRWLVDDIEIHKRSESGHPGSVRRQADAVGSLCRFLNAFASGDSEQLKDTSTPQFYDGTLQFADLKLVTLPSTDVAPDELSIRAFSGRVTIIVPTTREFVRFDLLDPDRGAEKHVVGNNGARHFQVDDVILNDRTRRHERTLGSVFTAPARASLFVTALQTRDIQMLKQLSTRDFNEAVWDRTSSDLLSRLTLPSAQLRNMKLKGSDVRGNRTELTFRTPEGGEIKCRMVEQIGRLLVDDIYFPDGDNQVLSLRVQSSLQIPIAEFTVAWRASDLTALKESCSTAFDRMVLNHFSTFPTDTVHLGDRLDTALRSTRVTQERGTVHMGVASSDTAEVHLIQEHGRWVIDDISIPEPDGQETRVRARLRQQVANNMLARAPGPGRAPGSTPNQTPIRTEQLRETRAVEVIRQTGGTFDDQGAEQTAVFEVYGPDSAGVTQKLQESRLTGSELNLAPEVREPSTPQMARTTETEETPELKPVPKTDPPLDDGEFMHFGPGTGNAKTTKDRGGDRSRSAVDTPGLKTLDLGKNPVVID